MVNREERVQWIYSSKDKEELRERYDQWAKDYDADLEEGFGWIGPRSAAEILAGHLADKSSAVLDAGAGTGLVGVVLKDLGFTNLIANDLSQGMLEEARAKGVYSRLYRADLTDLHDDADNSYDAVISVGVLTVGHVPPSALQELIRVTRPGGLIVYSLRPDTYETAGFKETQAALADQGLWELVEVTEPFQVLPKGEPDVFHQVWVYRVAPGGGS